MQEMQDPIVRRTAAAAQQDSGGFGLLKGAMYSFQYELIFSAGIFFLFLFTRRSSRWRQNTDFVMNIAGQIVELCGTKYAKALELFLERDDFWKLPKSDYLRLLQAVANATVRVGRPEKLRNVFAHIKAMSGGDPGVLPSVLRMFELRKLHGQALDAARCWREIFKDRFPDASLSGLLHCATEIGDEEAALDAMAALRDRDLVSARDFSVLIRLYASSGHAEKAMDLLREMESMGFQPDKVAYNMVLSACSSAKQDEQVESLLSQMDADVVTYNTRLKACVAERTVDKAFGLYDELCAQKLQPTAVTFGTLVECCCKAGDLERAKGVFRLMVERNVQANSVIYTSLIKGLAAHGKLEDAMEMFEQMKSVAEPDLICYSALIKAFCDREDLERAVNLLEEVLTKGHSPDEIVFNHLLAGCATVPDVERAEWVLDSMAKHGVMPTTATFSTMLKVYARAGDVAGSERFLLSIHDRYRSQPAPRLYLQHMSSCIRQRKGSQAVQIFKAMVQRWPSADGDQPLLSCVSSNLLDTACCLVEFDPPRFSAQATKQLVDTLKKKRKYSLLQRIDVALQESDVPFPETTGLQRAETL
jgi:pentatricopeptide repeat protein